MNRCCVFSKKAEQGCLKYEVLKKYNWSDDIYEVSFRELIKCTECGALFIHQGTEFEGAYSAKFIQVENEKNADEINEKNDAITFSQMDLPSICIFKGTWYFANLEPEKQMTREEQIEEIKK